MPSRPDHRGRVAALLLALLACAFLGHVIWLLSTRVSKGDVYPPYSTLRADPKGSKALYLTLDAMPGHEVERNIQPWHKLKLDDPAATTILVIGGAVELSDLTENEKLAMLEWLDHGARVVVTAAHNERTRSIAEDKKDDEDEEKVEKNEEFSETEQPKREELSEQGLFGLGLDTMPQGKGEPIASTRFPEGNWRGNRQLELPEGGGGWVSQGTVCDSTVIASRAIGKGELIVVADSTFATNEGVWRDRRSEFLLSLIGPRPEIIIDERLLGTVENPGIATLTRRLNLHGLFIGGALVLALLIWQGLCPLVPPDPARDLGTDSAGTTLGRDSAEGLVALLGRGLPPSRLLDYGIDLFARSRDHGPAPSEETIAKARHIAASATTDHLATAYLRIRDLLNQRP